MPWYSLTLYLPAGDELAPADVALLEQLPAHYRRVWLLSDPAELPGSLGLAESWLAARYPMTNAWEFEGGAQARVAVFALTSPRSTSPTP